MSADYIPAKYTEVIYNLLHNDETKGMINRAMSSYPLYKSTSKQEYIPVYIPTREELNKKILDYYMFREIGAETINRFCFNLETALNEIMPYYNLLYFSADQDFNIIYNVDYIRTINKDLEGKTIGTDTGSRNETFNLTGTEDTTSSTSGQTSGTSETESEDSSSSNASVVNNAKSVKSNTPQSQLGISNMNIDSVQYADEADWAKTNDTSSSSTTGTGSTSGTTSGSSSATGEENREREEESTRAETTRRDNEVDTTGKEDTLETTKGNFGVVSAQDLVLKYRETVINITQQIINDPRIAECFLLVY